MIAIAECEQLRAQDFSGKTIIVVATMQTLRVGNTASRDVYAYKEGFEAHFCRLATASPQRAVLRAHRGLGLLLRLRVLHGA